MTEPESGAGALICIPTYNERENIERIVPAVLAAVPDAEVLIIDDASPDGTGDIADRLAGDDSRVHVLHRPGKQGLGRAYVDGFRWALERDYAFVFEFDADFSHDPRYLPQFVAMLRNGVDVVVGSRHVEGGGIENWSALRRFISWGGSLYARTILGVRLRDMTGGYNGYRREALERIGTGDLEATGYGFQVELKYRAIRAGLRVVEAPIVFPDRVAGKSKMSSAIFSEAMLRVIQLRLGR
ncbi:MAG: polyprenol monophosphomannose synthase [Deltaproteobacteria bacterium]|jgi:dolichol-phosphate mannosyltransferase|nr:polyprenol monophosphomannose synthase [Deltaproteobacteria bacterium]